MSSLYVQITTRCNHTCAHCMFDCTMMGEHMAMRTFNAACRFAESRGDSIFIGGGEPTLHPRFWDIVGRVMRTNADFANELGGPAVSLVTNGSRTEDALRLARLAEVGLMYVSLSRDQFHDDIDERVVRAFQPPERRDELDLGRRDNRDHREIRNTIRNLRAVGRGANLPGAQPGCGDCDPIVTPDGRIWRCSCRKEQIGDVFKGMSVRSDDLSYGLGCSTTDYALKWVKGEWIRPEIVHE
jgi:hypothetical protein